MNRRYLFNQSFREMPRQTYDVVIAGGGMAGLNLALQLSDHLSCALLLKQGTQSNNSWLAQGGIAAVVDPGDTISQHVEDTLRAGAGLADAQQVRFMAAQGPLEIARLAALGVAFDRDAAGAYRTTREGAHSHDRVLHCGGDATGKLMMQRLLELVSQKPNVKILKGHFLADILTAAEGETAGVVAYDGDYKVLSSPVVVLCTGGIGGIYQQSTNYGSLTGDGIAAAIRAGAATGSMEFVQFHPTAFYQPGQAENLFLISEAVRGEGGVLRNSQGEAFMAGHHPLKDLAPRDVVSRAIFCQMQHSGDSHVWLDITARSKEYLINRFPTIYRECATQGILMERDPIPVVPVQHYFMGGVTTNRHALTSIPGLYACGEAAFTGVHGANRLASNSLLECLVFSSQCAAHINATPLQQAGKPHGQPATGNPCQEDLPAMKQQIRHLMQQHGGIIRTRKGLQTAFDQLNDLLARLDHCAFTNPAQAEVYNMALVGREIVKAALRREESVGAHYRND